PTPMPRRCGRATRPGSTSSTRCSTRPWPASTSSPTRPPSRSGSARTSRRRRSASRSNTAEARYSRSGRGPRCVMTYVFNFDVVWRNFDKLIDGLLLGLGMAVLSLLIGSVIGLLCAYARVSASRWIGAPVWLYVEFIRNTPILLLVFFVFFGLPEV